MCRPRPSLPACSEVFGFHYVVVVELRLVFERLRLERDLRKKPEFVLMPTAHGAWRRIGEADLLTDSSTTVFDD
jgi:hypothetical protein